MTAKLKVIVLLILVTFAGAAQADNATALIDEYLQACVDLQRFSGSVLVAKGGQIIICKGYGMANYELDVPNTPESVFRIGSVTKQFTALAILQLAEKGLLSTTDPISKYLPDYPNGKNISIHQLLTHTSGIADYTANPYFHLRSMAPISRDDLIKTFENMPVTSLPGDKFAYSNSGYILLGHIIEIITQQYYEDYLTDHILTPLGLTKTGYDLGIPLVKNRAAGYLRGPNGLVNALHVDMSHLYAAGALFSTVKDLYQWERALYTTTIVSQASLDLMFTPHTTGYGYGWYLCTVCGRRCTMHGGGVSGYSSFVMRFPDDDTVIILLANIGSTPVARIARDLAAIVFGEPYLQPEIKK